jgi:hypothetical protein
MRVFKQRMNAMPNPALKFAALVVLGGPAAYRSAEHRRFGRHRLRHQTQGVALVLEGLFRPRVRPNHSIEGTSNSKLRLPLAAPHVKR